MLGTAWTLGSVLWAMLVFYFWFVLIWALISVISDVFRRSDLSGLAKAGWTVLVLVFPLFGIVIYFVTRPKMTTAERMAQVAPYEVSYSRVSYDAAAEVERLTRMKADGTLTDEEYEKLRKKALS
jgi:hypothetical protein